MASRKKAKPRKLLKTARGRYTKKVWKNGKLFYAYDDSKSSRTELKSQKSQKTSKSKIRNNSTSSESKNNTLDTDEDTNSKEKEKTPHVAKSEQNISEEFLQYLKQSQNDRSVFEISETFKFTLLKNVRFGRFVLMEICLLILCFMYYCNVPFIYLSSLLALIGSLVPWDLAEHLPASYQTFRTNFIGIFFDMKPEKIFFGKSNVEMNFYSFKKKIQEKMNSRRYRKLLYEGKNQILQRRTSKIFEKYMEDINDGKLLRFHNERFLSFHHHLNFQIFIDGVSPFKGSSQKLLPVYLVNLQIPYSERYKLQNVIMIGLLSQNGSFDEKLFLEQLVKRMNNEMKEFQIKLHGKSFSCSAIVTCAILDTKEKESIFMMSNGYYACFYCYTKGETGVCFPQLGKLRTPSTFALDHFVAENFLSEKKSSNFRGCKGKSVFCDLRGIILPYSIPIDPMHCIDLGVIQYFLESWIGKSCHFTEFDVILDQNKLHKLDKFLTQMKVPDEFTRMPRSTQELGYWKADEMKCFALFYFPLMDNFLPREYFLHFLDFVFAYRLLSKQRIHVSDLKKAQQLLDRFCQKTKILYGNRMFTIKVHMVCYHIIEHVKNFGPLSQFSAKLFEDINGKLMRKNFGKFKITDQLMQKFAMASVIDDLIDYLQIEKHSTLGVLLGKVGVPQFSLKKKCWLELKEDLAIKYELNSAIPRIDDF